jgi:hypothetical protein
MIACTVTQESCEFQANVAFGIQEWLNLAALSRIEVRDPVCHALELKISSTLAGPSESGLTAYSSKYCSCSEIESSENACTTAVLDRGSRTAKSGTSLRIRVPADIAVFEKHPSPSPGDGRTV